MNTNLKNRSRLAVEALEDRLVPAAVGLYMYNGQLSMNGSPTGVNSIAVTGGTTNNPYIHVRGQLGSMSINRTFLPGQVTSLQFLGGSMPDTFINNTGLTSKAWGYGGNDKFAGGSNTDSFYGGDGTDDLRGMGGRDYLDGGAHTDYLYGNAGNDWLIGGTGADYCDGGSDSDVLIGGSFDPVARRFYQDGVNDNLFGGTGADVYVAEWFTSSGRRENRDYFTGFSAAEGDKVDNP